MFFGGLFIGLVLGMSLMRYLDNRSYKSIERREAKTDKVKLQVVRGAEYNMGINETLNVSAPKDGIILIMEDNYTIH